MGWVRFLEFKLSFGKLSTGSLTATYWQGNHSRGSVWPSVDQAGKEVGDICRNDITVACALTLSLSTYSRTPPAATGHAFLRARQQRKVCGQFKAVHEEIRGGGVLPQSLVSCHEQSHHSVPGMRSTES